MGEVDRLFRVGELFDFTIGLEGKPEQRVDGFGRTLSQSCIVEIVTEDFDSFVCRRGEADLSRLDCIVKKMILVIRILQAIPFGQDRS